MSKRAAKNWRMVGFPNGVVVSTEWLLSSVEKGPAPFGAGLSRLGWG
jgi:hypothetical protein